MDIKDHLNLRISVLKVKRDMIDEEIDSLVFILEVYEKKVVNGE